MEILERLRRFVKSRDAADPDSIDAPRLAMLRNLSRSELIECYWRSHPRFLFFKGVPPEATLLDVGCGSGGLALWRDWLKPDRTDIRLFGADLEPGEHTSRYEDVWKGDLDRGPVGFGALEFDAILASHVLEHLQEPGRQVGDLAARLAPGGRLYIEVPTPASKLLPSAEEFRRKGWPMQISNFHDDATHRETFSLDELAGFASAAGLQVEQCGVITSPLLADALMWYGVSRSDEEILLYGYWAKTGWAHSMVMRKPAAM
jgi:SAM-dependent methyltransferase